MSRNLLNNTVVLCREDGSSAKFHIKSHIGSGASCVVYHAVCDDNTEHLLKEYYPRNLNLERNSDGTLIVPEHQKENFDTGLTRFREGNEKQKEVRLSEKLKNFTSNVQGYFYGNGTEYIDMTVFSGRTYNKVENESLHTLLLRMRTLAQVIGYYHEAGLLHLDIKPENIFIRPEGETPEDIILFDFDSVLEKKRIVLAHSLSYTKDWAAPEQLLQYKRRSICEATDLFSIGEIIFTKIFGRHSTQAEHRSFAEYEIDYNADIFNNANPKVVPLLKELFKHTICSVVKNRYQTAQELIEKLDEIIKITEQKNFVVDNFSYNHTRFVGRISELNQIHNFLNSDNTSSLFVTGFGGIGKTELVKKYANIHRSKYDRIVFLRYKNSILETVAESLIISNLDQINCIEDCFKEKTEKAIADFSEKDLLIIDNFNVDFESFISDKDELERLQTLLEKCRCKKIITTRIDEKLLKDLGYKVLNIEAINSDEEIYNVFNAYNNIEYSLSDIEIIKKIINHVERHTLTVELLAKYLEDSKNSPQTLLQKLCSLEGITSINSTNVVNRKEGREYWAYETVNKHLLTLFELSEISDNEKSIIRGLSLFPDIRINKDLFADWCKESNALECLNHLIALGWIEYYDDKISLHQIILDLVYNNLQPDSLHCLGLVTSMTEVVNTLNNIPKSKFENLKIILKSFYYRLKGANEEYVEFILVYISYFINSQIFDSDVIEKAYQKTNIIDNKIQCQYLLALNLINNTDFWELSSEELMQLALNVKQYFTVAETLCDNSIIKLYNISNKLLLCIQQIDMHTFSIPDEINPALDLLYNYLIEIFNKLDKLIFDNCQLSKKETVEIYEFIANFFGITDYSAFYKYKFEDCDKYIYYCKRIAKLKTCETNNCNLNETLDLAHSNFDINEQIERVFYDDRYNDAIKLYESVSNRSSIDCYTINLIAKAYEKTENYYKAIQCYIELGDSDYNLLDIVRNYCLLNENEKAIQFCNKVITNNEFGLENAKLDDTSSLECLMLALIQKSKLVNNSEKELILRKLETIYFSNKNIFNLNATNSFNTYRDFMIEYFKNTNRIDLAMMEQLEFVSSESWLEDKDIFNMLCSIINYDSKDYWINHCIIYASMLLFSGCFIDPEITNSIENIKKDVCERALKKIDPNEADSKFLCMYFYNELAIYYEKKRDNRADYYFDLCDYMYMLDYALEIFNISSETEFNIRTDIAQQYRMHNKNNLAEKCHKQNLCLVERLELFVPTYQWWEECIYNCICMKKIDSAKQFCYDYVISLINAYIKSTLDDNNRLLSERLCYIGEHLLDRNLYDSAIIYLMLYAIFLSVMNCSKSKQKEVLLSCINDHNLLKQDYVKTLSTVSHNEEISEQYIQLCKKILVTESEIEDMKEVFDCCRRFLQKNCYYDIDFKL